MKPPLYLRPLTESERNTLREGLRSPDAFTLRRSQILLASEQQLRPSQIARQLGCSSQTVRNTLHAFDTQSIDCLTPPSKVPKTLHCIWSKDHDEDLQALLHQSPRHFGQPTRLWTLQLVAQVCYQKGWTSRQLSGEAIRRVLKRLAIRWKRAKHWISSPDPQYARKKKPGMNSSRAVRLERTGCSASRMRRGGPDWPNRRCLLGRINSP
jgi:transposase